MKKMKHVFWAAPLLFCLLSQNTVSASAANNEKVSVQKNGSKISLIIQEKGERYKIYKDEKLVYQGKNNKYIDNLDQDTHKYRVGIYQNNKLKDVISLKSSDKPKSVKMNTYSLSSTEENTSNLEKMKTDVENTVLESIVTMNSVELKWPEITDEDGTYEIYRNGEKIGQTKSLNYIDKNLKANTEYDYEVQVNISVSSEEKANIEQEATEQGVTLNDTDKKELFYHTGSVSTLVKTPINTETSLKSDELIKTKASTSTGTMKATAAGFTKDNEFSVEYKTFIPYKTVKDRLPGPNYGTYLHGDNRGYDMYSNKYRTYTQANAQFTNPTSVTLFPYIGTSYRYSDKEGKHELDRAKASTSGIKLSVHGKNTRKLWWSVDHSVGVPFGKAYPNIDYYYTAVIKSSGFSITGEHDKAPNHEVYLLYPSGTHTLHRYAVKSELNFFSLMGGPKTVWSKDI